MPKRNFFNYWNYYTTGDENRGPFNIPVWNPASAAYYHDKAYGRYGYKAYFNWNKADEQYLKDENHWLAKRFFQTKKLITKTLGMVVCC